MRVSVVVDNSESVEEYLPEVLDRDWGQEIFIARTKDYLGKILIMKAGTPGGLQFHVQKDETFYLHSGRAIVEYDDGNGNLVSVEMNEGQSFHVPPGAIHRTLPITDCLFIETSTPHFNDRVHAEHRYGGEDPTGGLPSTWATEDGTTYTRIEE